MNFDEQARSMVATMDLSDEDRASIGQALDEGEVDLITDGAQVVGLFFPIVDQDPGDEDD